MRPFFSYYGAKYTMAKHYGPPRSDVIIEPFAGSACYSTYWNVERAILCDVSPEICAVWRFLIQADASDIASIPDAFDSFDEVAALPDGARQLVGFWVAKGRAQPSQSLSPWYLKYRSGTNCSCWGRAVKRRLIDQLPQIRGWEIFNCDYRKAPEIKGAHWHIDPPYNNKAGQCYPYRGVDYQALAEWAKTRPGHVDVCENDGANWLEFTPIASVVSTRGRRTGAVSLESVWSRFPDSAA